MNNELIKRAVKEFYTEQQWIVLMLKEQWLSERIATISRDSLQLNKLTRIEICEYKTHNPSTTRQVYILLKGPRSLRPYNLSAVVDITDDYSTIRKTVHELLVQARSELYNIYRGRELEL